MYPEPDSAYKCTETSEPSPYVRGLLNHPVHISKQYKYFLYNIFIPYTIKMYDTSILSGTVHSNRTVAVLLHKQTLYFRLLAFKVIYTLSIFFNSCSIITNCTYSVIYSFLGNSPASEI